MRCAQCRRENPPGAKFCLECGQKLPAGCAACGHALPDGARFCVECGASTALDAPVAPARAPESYTPRHLADKILASRSAIEGERKPVTVLFCDVVSSTALAEQLGAEGMHTLLSQFFETALAEVHRYEGTINQFLGDGFMALFGAPLAHEDHARRAVLAALDLERAVRERTLPVTLRMGVHTGFVVVGAIGDNLRMDYTAVGDTTHLAARLQQAAAPGAIVISDATERLVRGYVAVETLGPTQVRGRSAPVGTYRVTGRGARRSSLESQDARALSEFVGRARELGALRDLLTEVAAGRGQAVGIVGEPGVGKSRLLLEFQRAARGESAGFVEGRCLSFGSAIPYAPVLDVVRGLCGLADVDPPGTMREKIVGTLDTIGLDGTAGAPLLLHLLGVKELTDALVGLTPEAIRTRSFEALRRLIVRSAARGPLVVVIEDLHWIDRTSEELVASLVDGLAGVMVMLLATYRPGYRPPWSGRSYATQLSLARLTPAESLAVVRSVRPGAAAGEPVAELILAKAEGNPFFLEELAHAVGDVAAGRASLAVPDTVHGVLTARIDRLADEPKRLLQTASILGREFPLRLLQAIWDGGLLDAHLHELTRQEFVHERAGTHEATYVFKHALTQDVAESTVLTARRRELHRRAADALIAFDPDRRDELAPLLAHHYVEAEAWTEATEHATRAAETASAVHANREALERYDQALSAAGQATAPPLDRRRLHAARGRVQAVLGRFDDARADYETALGIARAEGHTRACADLLGALAELWGGHKDYDHGLELALDAVRTAEQSGDRRALAESRMRAGLMSVNVGRLTVSRRELEGALAVFRDVGDEPGYAKALDILSMTEGVGGQIHRSIAHGREAMARYEALGDRGAMPSIWSGVGIWLGYSGHPVEGEELLRRGRDGAIALGARSDEAFARMALGQVGALFGGFGRGLREAGMALAIARDIGHREWTAAALIVIGRIHRECGDFSRARALHEETLGIARELRGAIWIAGALAELSFDAVALGDLGLARRSIDEAEEVGAEVLEHRVLARLADAERSFALGELEQVVEMTRRLRNDGAEFRVCVAETYRLEGEALGRLGRFDDAGHVLRIADGDAQRMAAEPVRWRALLALAEVMAAQGRVDDAAQARAEARLVLDRVAADLPDELQACFRASAAMRRAAEVD